METNQDTIDEREEHEDQVDLEAYCRAKAKNETPIKFVRRTHRTMSAEE